MDLRPVVLRDLCAAVEYGYTASASHEAVGPQFLRITDIVPDLIDWSVVPRCEIELKKLEKFRLKTNDIVVARTGATVGYAKRLRNPPEAVFASYLVRLTIDPAKADPVYIGAIVESRDYKEFVVRNAGGAAQPNANAQTLTSYQLHLPDLPTQRRIASILSAYDDLIENNTRRIAILEEMARRIYEEWFVRFRFPGHEQVKMVESELGLIPEGWRILTVADFGKVITGKTPSKSDPENFGNDVPFIKTPDMHGNIFCTSTGEGLSAKGAGSQKGKTLPPNSLCVSCIGTAGIVSITTTPAQTNQQINAVVLNDLHNREFLYFALVGLKETINLYGANGATMVNLNKSKFEGLKIVCGDRSSVDHYHTVASPMFEEIRVLQLKNANLRATRDLLLPKLISGELDVSTLPEPEEAIAA